MNIGIVCYPTFGGSGVVATELGLAMAEIGHQVHFIAYRQPARLESLPANVSFHKVRFADYPLFEHAPYESALASKIVDVALSHQLDLLHVHYAIPHAATAYMARQILQDSGYRLPVITTLHGTDITLVGRHHSYIPVVTFSINQSDGVTCVSESLKRETLEYFNITRPIEVIPNFVHFGRFRKKDRMSLRQNFARDEEKILVHVSNFRRLKRVDIVIRVFSQVVKEIPARLLLVGEGPELDNCRQLVRELNLENRVQFLGYQHDIEEILAIGDLFLIPSEHESFGLAALEAMACEVPVISSNIGGLGEINIHGKTGFLAPPGAIDQMANYALDVLNNPEKLKRFRENALEQAKKYDIRKIIPRYLEYYEKVINGLPETTGRAS